MTISPRLSRQIDRWYPLKPIPVQIELVNDLTRFIVVAAGRRSGKTERAKRKIVREAMSVPGQYFIAAPTYGQVKKIYWDDIKQLGLSAMCARKPSEAELILYLDNGSQIQLISLDVPERIEGIPWTGGIIDEFAAVKEKLAGYDEKFAAMETKATAAESKFAEIVAIVEEIAAEPAAPFRPPALA